MGVGWVELRVGGGGDAGEALEEGLGWGVEVLVGDAEDPAGADGFEVMPVTLVDDALEGDAVPCSTPAEEEDVGIGFGDGFGGGVRAGCAEESCAGSFHQFGNPCHGGGQVRIGHCHRAPLSVATPVPVCLRLQGHWYQW